MKSIGIKENDDKYAVVFFNIFKKLKKIPSEWSQSESLIAFQLFFDLNNEHH